jgi:hypothetical protein
LSNSGARHDLPVLQGQAQPEPLPWLADAGQVMRHAARVDANQADIVAALRAAGASVWIIGLPCDLLVGYAGKTLIVECKTLTGKRNPKPARHTQLQKDFMLEWKGGPVSTVTDVDGALTALKVLT